MRFSSKAISKSRPRRRRQIFIKKRKEKFEFELNLAARKFPRETFRHCHVQKKNERQEKICQIACKVFTRPTSLGWSEKEEREKER
jgi:hypothetical protein